MKRKAAGTRIPQVSKKKYEEPNKWLMNNDQQYVESEHINGYYGFVYKITNLVTGKKYIGRKYFWQFRKPKGKKRREKKESDWKFYYGSSKELLNDIKKLGKENFKREILSFHTTKGSTNYNETKQLFAHDVLEKDTEYYNDNILGRYFHSVLEKNKKEK